MNTEAAFEQAILDDPADDARRLVYADWLEERGDLRGEYLRVETALAKTDPADPRYGPLRERVSRLRNDVDRTWGTTFGPGRITAIEDLVYYLREFHKSWPGVPELDAASLPQDLPYGLALIYRELGGLIRGGRNPFSAQDSLASPGQIRREGNMLNFAWENQGNWLSWCHAGSEDADPPVYQAGFQRPPRKTRVSLNHFLTTLCLQEAVMSAPCGASLEKGYRLGEVVGAACRPLWLHGWLASDMPYYNFFDVPGQDLLIMDFEGEWLMLGSHSAASSALLRNRVRLERWH